MVKTVKDYRMEGQLANGRRAAIPCMRCLSSIASGDLACDPDGCIFDTTPGLWGEFLVDGKQAYRCYRCTDAGQQCFAVSKLAWIGASWA